MVCTSSIYAPLVVKSGGGGWGGGGGRVVMALLMSTNSLFGELCMLRCTCVPTLELINKRKINGRNIDTVCVPTAQMLSYIESSLLTTCPTA